MSTECPACAKEHRRLGCFETITYPQGKRPWATCPYGHCYRVLAAKRTPEGLTLELGVRMPSRARVRAGGGT